MAVRRVVFASAAAAALFAGIWFLLPDRRERDPVDPLPGRAAASDAESAEVLDRLPHTSQAAGVESIVSPPAVPDAPADTATDAAPVSREQRLELEISFASGTPARGVPVALGSGDQAVDRGVADRDGRVVLAAGDGRATLYIGGVGGAVHEEPLESPWGQRRVTLPDGAAISGVLTVGGAPPGSHCVALSIRRAEKGPQQVLPDAIWAALKGPVGAWGETYGPNAQRVTADGHFEFAGLVAGDAYEITFSEAYLTVDRLRKVELSAPWSGLHIGLIESPAVRGRAVLSTTRLPIPRCSVQCSVIYDSKRPTYYAMTSKAEPGTDGVRRVATPSSFSRTFSADEEGRFRIPLARPVANATLDLLDSETGGHAHLAIEGLDDVAGKDVGDVLLHPARTVRFQVRESGAVPVAGALALLDGKRSMRSQPTGVDGVGELTGVPVGRAVIRFAAAGFDTSVMTVDGTGDVLLDVRLSRCATLEVQVVASSGVLPPGLLLQLAASEQAYTGDEAFGPESIRGELGATSWSERSTYVDETGPSEAVSGDVRYPVPDSGLVSISCLKPAVSLKLSVLDQQAAAVSPEETVVLVVGETRRIQLIVVDGAAR